MESLGPIPFSIGTLRTIFIGFRPLLVSRDHFVSARIALLITLGLYLAH